MTNDQTEAEGGAEAEARTAVLLEVPSPSSILVDVGAVDNESSTTETAVGEDWRENGYAAAASSGLNALLVTC